MDVGGSPGPHVANAARYSRNAMTEQTDSRNGSVAGYLGDVQAMVADGLQALARQAESLRSSGHKDALPALLHGQRMLERQKAALRARLESFGGSSTTAPVLDALAAVAGFAAGLLGALQPYETVKSLRDDAAFFSALGVAYLLLYTTASALADADTASLAQEGYEDAARMVMHLDGILPKVTLEKLREENVSIADVTERVRAMVTKACDRALPLGI